MLSYLCLWDKEAKIVKLEAILFTLDVVIIHHEVHVALVDVFLR